MRPDRSILCVDDNTDHNELLEIFFTQAGYKIVSCTTPEESLNYIKTVKFSAVIFGNWLEDKIFAEVIEEIKIRQPQLPFVFFTAEAREASRKKALKIGARGYLIKPNDLENLVPFVAKIISPAFSRQESL